MRRKGILSIGVIMAVLLSSLYAIYSSVGAGGRHEGLGSLLASAQDAKGGESLDPLASEMIIEVLTNTNEWGLAEAFLKDKGFVIDPTGLRAYQYKLDSEVLSVLRGSSGVSANGSTAEIVLVMDSSDRISSWIMVSNLPQETVQGGQSTTSTIPVLAWSNGMPVFYVYFYHLIGGVWVPYHYWWHDSHNHPNWYYSLYNYWWWYYDWYGHEWWPWYDWFFAWYYNVRFCYWSTYFPVSEASPLLGLASIASLLWPWLILRRRRE
jgi:hypothetical protein